MTMLPISVCMISGAEADRIGNALASVRGWTSEIIVVLNQNTCDGTDEVAASYGARVCREPWKGHIAQKNSAASKATQPWILGLDADELVSPELRRELEGLFGNPGEPVRHAAFSFPRLTWFCGRWIRHGDWHPDRQTRLWKRGEASWGGVDPHDKLVTRGPVGQLRGRLLHHNSQSIDRQISKISIYSNDFLKQRDVRSDAPPALALALAVRPVWRFFRGYVLRAGFLDGWQGWYIAWMTAFYTATRYAKIAAESEKRRSMPEP